ncbi:MAG: heavy metal translocating P-type ATPase [Rhizobiaceae bacterium]|nr:heavy metal translocating P-type ATPase [Rhizobiaceae bacterium]
MTCCAAAISSPELCRETLQRTRTLEEQRIVLASVQLSNGCYKTDFIVPTMHCVACIGTIERGLADIAPVKQVRANLSLSTVSVTWDPAQGDGCDITDALHRLGFEHHLCDISDTKKEKNSETKNLLIALAVAGFAAANVMLLSVSVWSGADAETAQLFNLIAGLIAVPTVLFSGRPFFRSALMSLSGGRLNMDIPISLAVILALGMSVFESMSGGIETYFDASVTLLFFLLIGRYLDHLMRQKARGAVERLAHLSSKFGVRILPDKSTVQLPLKDIKPGMTLRVFAGERFPVNCMIVTGTTDIDCAHVTGESEHLTVAEDSLVEAGSLNLSASVDVKATSDAENSFLGEMRRMISEAENGRSSYLRIADRMAQIYAPAVHLLAFVAFLGWIIVSGGDWHFSIYTAIAVLIVTCPCALGLAVPVAHVIAANRLMQDGVLMRDGSALERLAEVDTVIFDKTGTLTVGEPRVTRVLGDTASREPLIKTLADNSSHPISKAVASRFFEAVSVELSDLSEQPGKGIEARHQGKLVRLGKSNWVAEIATSLTSRNEEHSVSFAVEGREMVHFDTHDVLRTGAKECIKALESSGLTTEMLSGDLASKVSRIAAEVGIDEYRHRQTPRQKIDRINALQSQGIKPLMVGDGINDAPALAAGHVSFVPASASDIGRQSADFVFTRPSLIAIPNSYKIALQTGKIVRQNFGLAIAYNCIAVPLAMAGFVTPLIAAIAMSASSILVVANSFRINFQNHESHGEPQEKNKADALSYRSTAA